MKHAWLPRRFAHRWSMRSRLLSIVLSSTVVAGLVGVMAMYWAATVENERMHDEHLAELAQTVMRFAEHELLESMPASGPPAGGVVDDETTTTLGTRFMYQIWSQDGRLMLRSHNAPPTPLAALGRMGYGTQEFTGGAAVTFVARGASNALEVHVADLVEQRNDVVLGSLAAPMGGFALAVLIVLVLAWRAMSQAVGPMTETAAQLVSRSPTDLTPLEVANMPIELQPIVDAINALFTRIMGALIHERDFSAMAAHELRTPLAALRLYAQVAQSASRGIDDAILKESLGNLLVNVDRCSHFVDQLLALARAEGAPELALTGPMDLERVVADVFDDMAFEADRRNIGLSSHLGVLAMHGRRAGVQTLLRNLVSNAIRYSPEGGEVEVRAFEAEDAVVLVVDDNGPGIPVADRDKVFDRFRRLSDDGRGFGLGLAIVRAVADTHRATIELSQAPLGGLRVQVRFPRPEPVMPNTTLTAATPNET
ncbi:sensor histidine kinase [Leptothrix ochracea]|uniref:sensor histidine kinase n=1 Tax=Leptothrix ochracea TaxID=735331 RepID=UPI0034E22BA0